MIVEALVEGRGYRIEIREKGDHLSLTIDGEPVEVGVEWTSRHALHLLVGGRSHDFAVTPDGAGYRVLSRRRAYDVELRSAPGGGETVARKAATGPAPVKAPMPGKIVHVLVVEGQEVAAGVGLLVIEAMKMENEIRSPRAGLVRGVAVREGQAVESGATLCVLE